MNSLLRDWNNFKNMNWIVEKTLSVITSYGTNQSRILMELCKKEYDDNIQEMYKDFIDMNGLKRFFYMLPYKKAK